MRRGLVAGFALALLVGASATAGGRLPVVAGDYTYELNGGTSDVQLLAFQGPSGASGSMAFHGTYLEVGGPVTCVTVHGGNAWIAGAVAWGDGLGMDGWMVRVVDHGSRDRAVTFLDEHGLAMAWCEGSSTELDAEYLQPVIDGWLVVR